MLSEAVEAWLNPWLYWGCSQTRAFQHGIMLTTHTQNNVLVHSRLIQCAFFFFFKQFSCFEIEQMSRWGQRFSAGHAKGSEVRSNCVDYVRRAWPASFLVVMYYLLGWVSCNLHSCRTAVSRADVSVWPCCACFSKSFAVGYLLHPVSVRTSRPTGRHCGQTTGNKSAPIQFLYHTVNDMVDRPLKQFF